MADAGRLEVLHDTETIINTYLQILDNLKSRWDYFADARSLSVIPLAFEVIKKAILEAKARDARVRFKDDMTNQDTIPFNIIPLSYTSQQIICYIQSETFLCQLQACYRFAPFTDIGQVHRISFFFSISLC